MYIVVVVVVRHSGRKTNILKEKTTRMVVKVKDRTNIASTKLASGAVVIAELVKQSRHQTSYDTKVR